MSSAVERGQSAQPDTEPAVFRFIRDALLQRYPRDVHGQRQGRPARFAGKFQQLTSPVTAKGIEDTAFYIYNRLVSLNEVGGEPAHFGVDAGRAARVPRGPPAAAGRTRCRRCRRTTPSAARTCAHGSTCCRRCPTSGPQHVNRLGRLNARHRVERWTADRAPTANEEYLLYQTLVGAWPLEPRGGRGVRRVRRARPGVHGKAMREAKVHTSWIDPNEAYETAVHEFVGRDPRPAPTAEFLADFRPFQRRGEPLRPAQLAGPDAASPDRPRRAGHLPGHASCGTSAWSIPTTAGRWITRSGSGCSTNFDRSHRVVRRRPDPPCRGPVSSMPDGRVKLYVTRGSPAAEAEKRRACFRTASTSRCQASGAFADRIFAFERRLGDRSAIVVLSRLVRRNCGRNAGYRCGDASRDRLLKSFRAPELLFTALLG